MKSRKVFIWRRKGGWTAQRSDGTCHRGSQQSPDTLRYQMKIKYMRKVFFQGAICKNWIPVALVFTPIAQELWTRMGKGASWLACQPQLMSMQHNTLSKLIFSLR